MLRAANQMGQSLFDSSRRRCAFCKELGYFIALYFEVVSFEHAWVAMKLARTLGCVDISFQPYEGADKV